MSLGILIVATVGFIPFLWRYRWRTSSLFLLSAAVFVTGAIGLEQYSGNQLNSLRYNMLTGLEEALEMSGVILAIYTALDFMKKQGSARNGSNYPDT